MIFLNTLECLLLLALGAFFFIECIYYSALYSRVYRRRRKEQHNPSTPVDAELPPLSVIVTAKNMGASLERNLPALLEQDYPAYEVIVVNDGSTDDTEEVLKRLQQRYKHLYHTFTPQDTRYVSRKKLSQVLGIRASKYDWLVFTEPYCTPVSNQWLRTLAARFTEDTDIVLGYGNYETRKGYWARKIRYDRLWHSLQYLSAAVAGHPYSGSGVNMAYRKALFYREKGFSTYLNLKRGEDDLFINELATRRNTRVALGPESVVRMELPLTKKFWADEQMEHCATSHHYKGLWKPLLALETPVRLLFLLEVIALIAHAIYYQHWLVGIIALLLYLLRAVLRHRTFAHLAQVFDERPFRLSLLWFDWAQPLSDFRHWLKWRSHDQSEFLRW